MKKIYLIAALAAWGASTLAFAVEQVSVDAQIAAIEHASPKERVEMMNRFKMRLMQMNQKQRSQAIAKMRAQMQVHAEKKGASTHENAAIYANEAMHMKAKEHMQGMQMQVSEEIHSMQQMNHQQIGSHFGAKMEQNGGGVHMPKGDIQQKGGFDMNFKPNTKEHR